MSEHPTDQPTVDNRDNGQVTTAPPPAPVQAGEPAPDAEEGGQAELAALDPQTGILTLASGYQVVLKRMRTRQCLKLLRIITHGAAGVLSNFDLNPNDDQQVFMARLVTMVVLAIPDAEDETLDFLMSMVEPIGMDKAKHPEPAGINRNNQLLAGLAEHLENPDLADTVGLIVSIVRVEAPHVQALGKLLAGLFKTATAGMNLGQTSPA